MLGQLERLLLIGVGCRLEKLDRQAWSPQRFQITSSIVLENHF